MRKFIIFILIVVLIPAAYSAHIHGTVYDLTLDQAQKVKVMIDSQPKQMYISQNGSYGFDVPPGNYTLSAMSAADGAVQAFTQENITIISDGDYVIDLILFPDFDEEELILEGLDELRFDEAPQDDEPGAIWVIYVLIGAFILLLLYHIFLRKHKLRRKKVVAIASHERHDSESQPDDDHGDAVIGILKQHGCIMSQKDLRASLPFSEAKVSLIIADLEARGIVSKVRKGRGNIIRLVKS